jgi:hypothetical protein
MQTLRINGGWWQFIGPLRKREDFRAGGAMRGENTPHGAGTLGDLPAQWHDSARSADYVVYSYVTPIAWHAGGAWVMPEVSYSVTTTRQQGRIATALSVLDDPQYDQYAT